MIRVDVLINVFRTLFEFLLGNVDTVISAVGTVASATLAYFTYNVYQEQNNLIEDQAEAAKQAQSASIQTLGVRAGGVNTLYVIAKNSGGGAAKELQGIVEFNSYAELGVMTESFVHEAVRQAASSNDQGNSDDWIPSEGNQIAAGESEVVLRLECLGQEVDEGILGFPKMVRTFLRSFKIEQLKQFREELTDDELNELAEDWDASLTRLPNSTLENLTSIASNFTVDQLRQIAMTAEEEYLETNTLCLDNRLQLLIKLSYRDVNEKSETEVVDLTFPMKEDQALSDIVSDEFRTQRIEDDPEGYALQESG